MPDTSLAPESSGPFDRLMRNVLYLSIWYFYVLLVSGITHSAEGYLTVNVAGVEVTLYKLMVYGAAIAVSGVQLLRVRAAYREQYLLMLIHVWVSVVVCFTLANHPNWLLAALSAAVPGLAVSLFYLKLKNRLRWVMPLLHLSAATIISVGLIFFVYGI